MLINLSKEDTVSVISNLNYVLQKCLERIEEIERNGDSLDRIFLPPLYRKQEEVSNLIALFASHKNDWRE